MTKITPQQMRDLAEAPDENHWSAAVRDALSIGAAEIEQWIRLAAKMGERIDKAPHDRACSSFSWNGRGWDHNPDDCTCWKMDAL